MKLLLRLANLSRPPDVNNVVIQVMSTYVAPTDIFCLDPAYSTTRLVSRETPTEANSDHRETKVLLFLPENKGRKGEGGLRTQGHYKKSLPHKPLVTVITVVFNGEKHLEETILSVINQTYDNVEYIIIDGGSTDGTVDVIRKYERQIDYWVSEEDKGIYYAMNKAVALSTGDWVYVLGSDDKLYAEAMQRVSKYLASQETAYYGDVKLLSSGEIFAGRFSTYKMMYYNISHQSIFYPRSFILKNRYDVNYQIGADFELLMRCHGTRDYKLQYIPEIIAEYNDVDGISSKQEDPNFLKDRKAIVKKNFSPAHYFLYAIRYYAVLALEALSLKRIIKLMIARVTK